MIQATLAYDPMLPTLNCATTNLHKVEEFRHALEGFYQVEQLPGLNDITPPEETGDTFAENAALKAVYYSRHATVPVFADDSGLSVDALNGQPGVRSARYAGAEASDQENNRLLLTNMQGVANRTARFVCVIALAVQGRLIHTFEGTVEGHLLDAPRGASGFGYDPLFFFPPFGCTFGEAGIEQKTGVSARGKAVRAMRAYLLPSSDSSR